jgi:hypothetical protein
MTATTKRTARRFAVVVAVLAGLGLMVWSVRPKSATGPAWSTEYDVTASPPETLTPGTVVERTAPAGWSHLVIKSLPRVRPGEESKIPLPVRSRTVRMASWMFTVFTADVQPERRDGKTLYKLRAVGLGLGTASGGRDIVITPETASDHGIELDWITREILTRGYKTLRLAVVVVHGPAFGLVDTPVWYRCGAHHRLIRFRYALVVDAASGRLDVLAWLLDPEGDCADGAAVVLAPDTIDEAELLTDPTEFNAIGIPSDAAFAVDGLPPHRARLLLPPDLRPLAEQVKYTPTEAGALEMGLRRLLEPRK